MNLIDKYIIDHYNEPMDRVATTIGISTSYLEKRKAKLYPAPQDQPFVLLTGLENEMAALVQFIQIREAGWAVEVAKIRLQQLQRIA